MAHSIALVARLRDEQPSERQAAAEALEQIGPGAQAAVPALIAILKDEQHRVREAAQKALGQIDPTWTQHTEAKAAARADLPAARARTLQREVKTYESTHTASSTPSPAQVRWGQKLLKELGFDPGPVDGLLGSQTKAALRQYQAVYGLPGTGLLDEATQRALVEQERLLLPE